jgi:peroxiredoxin
MARTPSNMLELGTKAPEFTLIDTITEQEMSINNIKGDTATVVMFIFLCFRQRPEACLSRSARRQPPRQ